MIFFCPFVRGAFKIIFVCSFTFIWASGNAQTVSDAKPIFKTPPEYDEGRPLYIQGNLPDISLGKMINYKNATAWRSDFGNKLIIFDFWNTHCAPCVREILRNDSIQKKYSQYVQVIMVTKEPTEDVKKFVVRWQQQYYQNLSIPVVVEDEVITSYFHILYHPSYAWVLPTGKFIIQSAKLYLNRNLINQVLGLHSNSFTKVNN